VGLRARKQTCPPFLPSSLLGISRTRGNSCGLHCQVLYSTVLYLTAIVLFQRNLRRRRAEAGRQPPQATERRRPTTSRPARAFDRVLAVVVAKSTSESRVASGQLLAWARRQVRGTVFFFSLAALSSFLLPFIQKSRQIITLLHPYYRTPVLRRKFQERPHATGPSMSPIRQPCP
jgi:hypothetical protein